MNETHFQLQFAISVFISCFALSISSASELMLPQGRISGNLVEDEKGRKYVEFLGIPYGKANRFEKPQEPNVWQDVLNCTNFRARCFDVPVNGEEFPLPADKNFPQSENCLFANVFSPFTDNENFTHFYPVMVYIHGGGFSWGSSVEYGRNGIRNILVSKNVIIVTFNYRLGPWGFLQYDSYIGNYGLWDQILLLKWVKTNINKFHGNAEKITLFGESAGATSASLLTLSPISRDLFNNVILMSDGYSPKWLSNKQILHETSRYLVGNFSCTTNESCLKNVSVDQLRNFSLDISSGMFNFGPNVDDTELFPLPLDVLLKESTIKNVIIGTTRDESGLLLVPPVASVKTTMQIKNLNNYSMNDFADLVAALFSNRESYDTATKFLIQMFEKDNFVGETNSTIILQNAIQLCSRHFSFEPIINEAHNRHDAGQTVWLYSFDYYNDNDFPSSQTVKGAFHMMELRYLFNFTVFGSRPWNERDVIVSEIFSTLWSNFTQHGSPAPSTVWAPLNEQEKFQYFSLSDNPKMEKNYNGFGDHNATGIA